MDITWNNVPPSDDLPNSWFSADGKYCIQQKRGTQVFAVFFHNGNSWSPLGDRNTLRRAQVRAQVHAA